MEGRLPYTYVCRYMCMYDVCIRSFHLYLKLNAIAVIDVTYCTACVSSGVSET